jgi:phosphoinositide-3-kinase regulatory subunit 4
MISQMLSLDPADRLRYDRILSEYRGTVFPEYFYTFLQDYVESLAETSRDEGKEGFLQRNAPTAGHRIDRLSDEWDSISVHLEEAADEGTWTVHIVWIC